MNKFILLFLSLSFNVMCFAIDDTSSVEIKMVSDVNYFNDTTDTCTLALKSFVLKNISNNVLWIRLKRDESNNASLDDLYQELFKYDIRTGGGKIMFALDPNVEVESYSLFSGLTKRLKPNETFTFIVFDYKSKSNSSNDRLVLFDTVMLSNHIQVFNETDIILYRKSGEILKTIEETNKVLFFQEAEVLIPLEWIK